MNEWLNANADGIALVFWACLAGLLLLGVAALAGRLCGPRDERGPWRHLATVNRAKRQMATGIDAP